MAEPWRWPPTTGRRGLPSGCQPSRPPAAPACRSAHR
jgi:hypothetical protein